MPYLYVIRNFFSTLHRPFRERNCKNFSADAQDTIARIVAHACNAPFARFGKPLHPRRARWRSPDASHRFAPCFSGLALHRQRAAIHRARIARIAHPAIARLASALRACERAARALACRPRGLRRAASPLRDGLDTWNSSIETDSRLPLPVPARRLGHPAHHRAARRNGGFRRPARLRGIQETA